MRIARLVAAAAAVAALAGGSAVAAGAYPSHHPAPRYDPVRQLVQAEQATTRYQNLAAAKHDGYGIFHDLNGITCIADTGMGGMDGMDGMDGMGGMEGMGGMGVHYVKGANVDDSAELPSRPEAVVYEPDRHGHLHLVALEYLVPQAAWDKTHHDPPSLFGQPFMFNPVPNRFLPVAFYSLHVWLYKANPSGLFAMWNPQVHCPAA
jgi:hypothetical protein